MNNGAQKLVEFLRKKNVDHVFVISGAGNLAILDELSKHNDINLVFGHHEQSLVMAAQGYSRVQNRPGVVLVTTGGGTTNAVTGVLSANLDSIPVFIISGNESSFHCEGMKDFRAFGVQGFDSVSMMRPITKFSARLSDVHLIDSLLEKCWNEMISGRQGPVQLDFPMDLQRKIVESESLSPHNSNTELKRMHSFDIIGIIELIKKAKKPIIYLGNGLRVNNQNIRILTFLRQNKIPFSLTWSAKDYAASEEELNIGLIGIYGERSANLLLQQCDLFLSIGSRLAIPQIGYNKIDFARKAKKIIVDIDPIELSKFENIGWQLINTTSEDFLDQLFQNWISDEKEYTEWYSRIAYIKNKYNERHSKSLEPEISESYIHSVDAISLISKHAATDAILVTDVGAALLSGHYGFDIKNGQRFFTSQGLGEMGFGLPAAIGAYFAAPSRQNICLNTDGAIMFNLQDLQIIREFNIPMKLFIFANEGYAMIRISQTNLFEGNLVGSTTESGISFPDFEKLASTFNLKYESFSDKDSLDENLSRILSDKDAYLIEIKMDPSQKYYPRLATSKLADGTLVSPPLEDLDPKLSLSELEDGLGYEPTSESKAARK